MKVVALYRYPIKSLGGQSVAALEPRERGFTGDRRWMLIDTHGRFVSQREYPQLARFTAEILPDNGLGIRERSSAEWMWKTQEAQPTGAPQIMVTVWDDTFTATLVETPADFGDRLGLSGVRLVYMDADSRRPVDQRYAGPDETVSFADGFPYLIASTGSLAELGRRYGEALDMLRFRPNVVVNSSEAFAEDNWASLSIGDHKFDLPKPCARCIMVTNEPTTGDRDPRVLASLAAFRKRGNKVLFGENALWRGGVGPVRLGDTVTVTARRSD
ncbi:MOSC domain-containing protein [Neolewinella litorea]|uniref:MOSC domain-containing protein n=1 Tax=Neolewinella litorea TaxID=2562452 RepID=A0A4S4NS95_9BACT|nr:MOSC N-terminal beta barrel domain-containing protein [Neolewinella litorea]THH41298.1 MOSC domain-containing protein [Neolewinella litorea]